ncbi:MAG TPA: bifunctional phosphoribosyl-AMP cyclohydrolase/phosphoribosyl-ATP diphosphatase HisIE, partial [Candidatus Nanoarchaeia archaeon]|nr:bifunctional phosphoribosyl-AMP cyclohydrolase/phosphoribosyl-ATP diphosphatase HisIE [Candidatus Nanoarchaeia archaeon]
KNSTKNDLTVAGGITTFDDIKSIEEMGANSQVGMALYTNKIDLAESFIALLDFEKSGNMIPTIAQDEFGKVLMLAFSTKESLIRTFRTGKATYFSRSRKELWTKGETSGNFQQILKVRADCDSDALLFTVRQTNVACHTGSYSCFGGREFGIHELYSTVLDRIKNPQDSSYTSKLAQKEESIMEKIKEESEEVVNYRDKDNLVWEIADLTYFILVLMAKKGITVSDITNELWRRKK